MQQQWELLSTYNPQIAKHSPPLTETLALPITPPCCTGPREGLKKGDYEKPLKNVASGAKLLKAMKELDVKQTMIELAGIIEDVATDWIELRFENFEQEVKSKYIKGAFHLLKTANLALKGVDLVNNTLPFFSDLLVAPTTSEQTLTVSEDIPLASGCRTFPKKQLINVSGADGVYTQEETCEFDQSTFALTCLNSSSTSGFEGSVRKVVQYKALADFVEEGQTPGLVKASAIKLTQNIKIPGTETQQTFQSEVFLDYNDDGYLRVQTLDNTAIGSVIGQTYSSWDDKGRPTTGTLLVVVNGKSCGDMKMRIKYEDFSGGGGTQTTTITGGATDSQCEVHRSISSRRFDEKNNMVSTYAHLLNRNSANSSSYTVVSTFEVCVAVGSSN